MSKLYWNYAKNSEPMSAGDWIVGIAYLIVLVVGYFTFGMVAFWVYAILELRDMMERRGMSNKTLGDPSK
jgi:hypothetical protein